MKLFAIILAIIGLSKLFIASGEKQVELRKLVSGMPVHADLLDPFTKSIIIVDGLIGLICGLFIIFAI